MPDQRRRRPVGSGVEGLAAGSDEDVQRPAEVLGEDARGRHVAGVDIRVLLPIDFDRDEVLVEEGGEHRVAEALPRHDVAPVAGGVADGDQHRDVAPGGLGERLGAPLPPIDRVVGMGAQVRTDGIDQAIRHGSSVGPRCSDRAVASSGCRPTANAAVRQECTPAPGRIPDERAQNVTAAAAYDLLGSPPTRPARSNAVTAACSSALNSKSNTSKFSAIRCR